LPIRVLLGMILSPHLVAVHFHWNIAHKLPISLQNLGLLWFWTRTIKHFTKYAYLILGLLNELLGRMAKEGRIKYQIVLYVEESF
jgi:hypothetical protein